MDWVKEVIEASNAKIKSPVLGSVVFAFLAANWKSLFYLGFADQRVIEKFRFFDENTTWITLFLIPVSVGIGLSWLNPRIHKVALHLNKKPIQDVRIEQMRLASDRAIEKQKLEIARSKLIASKEETLIDAAKRTEEIGKIEDSQVREDLMREIENLRDEVNMVSLGPIGKPDSHEGVVHKSLSRKERLDTLNQLVMHHQKQLATYQYDEEKTENTQHQIDELLDEIRRLTNNGDMEL